MAQGLSNKEVARQLGLSSATVRKHPERICRKPGVSGRAAAVTRMLEPEGGEGHRPEGAARGPTRGQGAT